MISSGMSFFTLGGGSSAPSSEPPPSVQRKQKQSFGVSPSTSVAFNSSVAFSAAPAPAPPAEVSSTTTPAVETSNPPAPANPEEVSNNVKPQKTSKCTAPTEVEKEGGEEAESSLDITQFPKLFDAAFDRLDSDHAVRPMIIKPADSWQIMKQKNLLVTAKQEQLQGDQLTRERKAAIYLLLDAITRSGALHIEHAALHVLIGANHCFGDSLMNSIVQRNMNPIEVMERSNLIMATVLLDAPSHRLVQTSQLRRLLQYSPQAELEGEANNLV